MAAITNVGPGAVQGPQINRLACRQIGPASFELAFHVATLDPDKMLAGRNMVTALTSNSAIVPVAAVPRDKTSLPPSTRPAAVIALADWAATGCPVPTLLSPHQAAAATTSNPSKSFAVN